MPDGFAPSTATLHMIKKFIHDELNYFQVITVHDVQHCFVCIQSRMHEA